MADNHMENQDDDRKSETAAEEPAEEEASVKKVEPVNEEEPAKGEESGSEEEQYAFLQEHVKKKPFSRKHFFAWLGKTAAAGAVIGIVACLFFYAFTPWFKSTFESSTKVTIPEDQPDVSTDDTGTDTAQEPQNLTVENYTQLYTSLNAVVYQARKSMVTVTGVVNTDDWFNSTYSSAVTASGVIVAETGPNYLILAPASVSDGAAAVKATFMDSNTYSAQTLMRDKNTGLAVYSVLKAELQEGTRSSCTVASLGNSYTISDGSPVILLGSPFGTDDGQAYGIISTTTKTASIADGTFSLITSDVGGAENSSGVFLNISGDVVGIMLPGLNSAGSTVSALPISNVKNVIEKLSNGTPVPYFGISGVDVDKTTAKDENLSEGIYVTNVAVDSPAMTGGIQSGDIISKVDGQDILTMQALRATIMNHAKGNEVTVKGKRLGADGYTDIEFNVTIGSLE